MAQLHILLLPEELLLRITDAVWEMHLPTLCRWLRSCKTFHRIGKDLLYKQVCITSRVWPTLSTPLSMLMERKPAKELLQTLRLTNISTLTHLRDIDMGYIVAFLSKLTQLKTFCINMRADRPVRLNVNDIYQVIRLLLRSLPGTVVNLEVVTHGVQDQYIQEHICDDLGDLLPQLETLRLSIPRLCTEFTHRLQGRVDGNEHEPLISRMRFAIIHLKQDHQEVHFHVRSHQPSTLGCASRFGFNNELYKRCTLNASHLARMLSELQSRGRFPHLQHFAVINSHNPMKVPLRPGEDAYWKVRDLINDTTTTIPILAFETEETVKSRIGIQPNWERGEGLYFFRDIEGNDLCARSAQVAEYLESTTWNQLPNGIRLPPRLLATEKSNERHEILKQSIMLDREASKLAYDIPPTLQRYWDREDDSGVWARARLCQGLSDDAVIKDKLPPEVDNSVGNAWWVDLDLSEDDLN